MSSVVPYGDDDVQLGRVQLVKSVITGIINFWQSAFYLPADCLRELESICSSFIWNGLDLNSSAAKLSWEHVCLPKEEGGLGLRRFKDVNKVNCLKLIWRLVSVKESLWANWVSSHILKGRSFWEVKNSTLGSWVYKKLRKHRSLAKNMHKVEVRSGHGTSFWYDAWFDLGCLYDLVGPRGTIDMGISLTASLAEVLAMRRRRRHRSVLYRQIEEAILCVAGREGADIQLWLRRPGCFASEFSSSHSWRQIRTPGVRVFWHHLAWFSQATPKFAFITWLALHNRLSTMDRIKIWNRPADDGCVLCNSDPESIRHLFFRCCYSREIWKALIGTFMGSNYAHDWDQICTFLLDSRMDRVQKFIVKYVFQAVLYAVWMERNNRRHGKVPQTHLSLIQMLDKGVRNKISSMREHGLHWMDRGLQLWFSAH